MQASHPTNKGDQDGLWTSFLARVPGAEYFMQLKRPQDISLDYLRYCRARSSQKDTYNGAWTNTILPTLRESGHRLLEQEYVRLDRAWRSQAPQIEAFWSSLRAEEIERADTLLNEERILHLKRNAVEQLTITLGGQRTVLVCKFIYKRRKYAQVCTKIK